MPIPANYYYYYYYYIHKFVYITCFDKKNAQNHQNKAIFGPPTNNVFIGYWIEGYGTKVQIPVYVQYWPTYNIAINTITKQNHSRDEPDVL